MSSLPVACVGHRFEGYCSSCDGTVQGTLTSGEYVTIEDCQVCVTGSEGTGDCGHKCTVIGQSEVLFIEDKPVARIGDPVIGTITGHIITGSDFVTTE